MSTRIVYSSFYGRYSDTPRVLFEALRVREAAGAASRTGSCPRFEHVWLADPAHAAGFPDDVDVVEYGSSEGRAALEAADVIVANHYLSMPWTKKPGAAYWQTWHGTPLKRIHFDVAGEFPFDHDLLVEDVARWDHLLSQNPYCSVVLPRAFGYDGPVHEVGSPRDDVLLSPRAGALRSAVRHDLGIPDDATVVLYAPTWRDDVLDAEGRRDYSLHVDLEALTRGLGDDHVVLLRLHYLVSDQLRRRRPEVLDLPGLRDVSAYPEAADLFLAADALVTDYSSVMVDFAVTGRPMVFHAPDLADFQGRLRGFYIDYPAEVPGPIVATTEDLVTELRALGTVAGGGTRVPEACVERYDRFRRTFVDLEDGHAADRVVDLVLEHLPSSPSPSPSSSGEGSHLQGVQVVVLAAGMGTRLGGLVPKPLTRLATGSTILHQQIDNIRSVLGDDVPITLVVGYRADLVTEAAPDVSYVLNPAYERTNTSKSLLLALEETPPGGVLWLNGDVVFDAAILELVLPLLEAGVSFVCVNTEAVGDEEVKYTVDAEGWIEELSKTVEAGLGEAVGINHVSWRDRPTLVRHLAAVEDGDYFERGIERAIVEDGLRVLPVDISGFHAVEVDVEADLHHANQRLPG